MNRRLLFDGGAREIGVLPIQSALSGSLSATLGAANLSSTGNITGAGIDGNLTQTLDAAILSSNGTLTNGINGNVTRSLNSLTFASRATTGSFGSVSKTLDAVTLTATGNTGNFASILANLDSATLSSNGSIGGLGIGGAVTVTLSNAILSAQGQGSFPEKTIYQEIWIVEEKKKKKKAKKKLRKNLDVAFEALELAQESQAVELNWKIRQQAVDLAQAKLEAARASLALFDAETALQEAIYQQKTFDETQALLRLEFERLAEISRQEEERRVAEENEELMMLMAYMLQLD